MRRNALAAVMAVLLISAVPFCALISSAESDADESADKAMYATNAQIGLLTQIKMNIGTEFIAIGLALMGSIKDNDTNAIAEQEEVNAELRNSYAYTVQSNYQTASELFAKLVSNQAMTLAFIRAYYALQAETAAGGMWSENIDYNGDRILLSSNFMEDMSIANYNIKTAINQFAQKWDEEFSEAVTSKSGTYGSMRMGWTWGSNNIYSGGAYMSLLDYVIPTSDSNRVYIASFTDDQTSELTGRNSLYVFGSGSDASILNMTTGRTYAMVSGMNDLEARGIPSGWYLLKEGYTYAGNLMPSSEINGLSPNAALVLTSGSDIALAVKSGDAYTVTYNNVPYVTSDIKMAVSYDSETAVQDVTGILDSYQKVWDAMNAAADSAVDAGLAAWLIFDAAGESSSLIKPSSILASMQNGTEISPELMAAYYSMALQTLIRYGGSVTPDDFTVSKESSNLFMYGNIYYQGNVVYEGAVFTPFVPEDMAMSVGAITPWSTTGQVLIYGTGFSSLEEWDGTIGGGRIVEMNNGFSTQLFNIVSDGTEVNRITLTHDKMTVLGLMDLDYLVDPPEIKVESKAKYVQIIMTLIGAILIFVGFMVPGITNKAIVWIIAVALILIGLFAPGWVAWLF